MLAEGVGMAVGDNTEDRKGRFLWVVGRQEFEDEGSLQDEERRMAIDIGFRQLQLPNK